MWGLAWLSLWCLFAIMIGSMIATGYWFWKKWNVYTTHPSQPTQEEDSNNP